MRSTCPAHSILLSLIPIYYLVKGKTYEAHDYTVSPSYCHFIPLMPKYSPHHSGPRYPSLSPIPRARLTHRAVNGGSKRPRNVCELLPDCTLQQPEDGRLHSQHMFENRELRRISNIMHKYFKSSTFTYDAF